MTFISCQKGSELLPEKKSSNNSDDSGELSFPYPPSHPNIPSYNTLLYEYDGYWSMRHGEYFRLDDRNKWEGTGYIPDSPAGVEGQTPPSFKDMPNLYGRMTQERQR